MEPSARFCREGTVWVRKCWGLGRFGRENTPFLFFRSVSLSVHVLVVLREDQGRGHKLATSECLLCSQHPGFARHEFIANTLELEGFAI